MIKLQKCFVPLFPRICQNFKKFYSKPAEKVKPLNSADSLEFQKSTTDTCCSHKSVSGSPQPLASGDSCPDHCKRGPRTYDMGAKRGDKCGQLNRTGSKDPGPPGGGFIVDKCDYYDIPRTNSKKWRRNSFIMLSIAAALSAIVFATIQEHPKAEYIPYEYMHIHNKRFPWGEGKRSLFHGRNNIIPEEE